jgi:large subunit ribosomal protein L33
MAMSVIDGRHIGRDDFEARERGKAMAKSGALEFVWLQCTETGELNYRIQLNTRGGISEGLKDGERKYCPRLRKHTIHKI